MEQLTKHQIIDETVEYYSNNPRAVKNDFCEYLTEDGRMCAHSRCLTNEARERTLREWDNGAACDLIDEYGDDIHQKQYRGHEKRFWRELQLFHDGDNYWENNGLSDRGKTKVKELKEKWNN